MKKLLKIATSVVFSVILSATVYAEDITEEKIFDLSTVFNNHIYDYKTAWGTGLLGNGYEHNRAENSYWGTNLLWARDGTPVEKIFSSIIDENFEKANEYVRFRFSPVTNKAVGTPANKDTLMVPKEGYTLDLESIGAVSNYESIYFAATARAKNDTEKAAVAQGGLSGYEVTVTYEDDTTEETILTIHGGLNENAYTLFIKAYASMLYGNSNPSPLCIHYYKLECDSSKAVKSVTFKASDGCTTEGKIIVWAMTGYESVASKIGSDILALGTEPTLEDLRAILKKIDAYKEKGGKEEDIPNFDAYKTFLAEYVSVDNAELIQSVRGAKIKVEFSGLISHESFGAEILKGDMKMEDYFTHTLSDENNKTTALIDIPYVTEYDAAYKLILNDTITSVNGKAMVSKFEFEYEPKEFLKVKVKSANVSENILSYNVEFEKQFEYGEDVKYFFTIGMYSDDKLLAVDYKTGTVEEIISLTGEMSLSQDFEGVVKCHMLNSTDLKTLVRSFEITVE